MKIGFDAKWFFDGPPSGKRIVRGLVDALCRRTKGEHELHLFLDGDYSEQWQSIDLPRAQQHFVWARNNQLANVFGVPGVADRLKLDVVAYQNFVPPTMLSRHARIAFVHDVIFHETPRFFTRAERLYFSTVRPLTRRADRACTVSQFEKDRMVRLGFSPADRIDVVPYGIDDVFSHRTPDTQSRVALDAFGIQAPFLLYVGRLTIRKNVDTLIRAMQCVQKEPLELVIVGAADSTAGDLPALAAALGVSHRVRFLGPIYDERLASLYSEATAFCFPTWDESYGLPPLEAMAAGTPCIVSDIAVLREMYGDAAVYANPHDHQDFARAIDAVVTDQSCRATISAKGRVRAREFTWDRAADLLLASAERAVDARQ